MQFWDAKFEIVDPEHPLHNTREAKGSTDVLTLDDDDASVARDQVRELMAERFATDQSFIKVTGLSKISETVDEAKTQ